MKKIWSPSFSGACRRTGWCVLLLSVVVGFALSVSRLSAQVAGPSTPLRLGPPQGGASDLLQDLQTPRSGGSLAPRQEERPQPLSRPPRGREIEPTLPPLRTTQPELPPRPVTPQDSFGASDRADPTQASPNVRRILEGEQVRNDPLPPIEVVGKVLRTGQRGQALLRVQNRYMSVSEGTRLQFGAIVVEIRKIDVDGVQVQSNEDNQLILLQ